MLRAPLPTTLNYNLAIHSNDSFWIVQKDQASLSAVRLTTPRRPVQTGRLRSSWPLCLFSSAANQRSPVLSTIRKASSNRVKPSSTCPAISHAAARRRPPTDDTPRKPRRRPRSGENMAGRLMHPGSTRGARSGGCRPSTPNPPSPERALRAELFYRGNDFYDFGNVVRPVPVQDLLLRIPAVSGLLYTP